MPNSKLWAFKRTENFYKPKKWKTHYFLISADDLLTAHEIAGKPYPLQEIFAISKVDFLKHAPTPKTPHEQQQRDEDAQYIQG